jgi:hypothetical protein
MRISIHKQLDALSQLDNDIQHALTATLATPQAIAA